MFHHPDGAGVDEDAVTFAALHHFGVASDHVHVAAISRRSNGTDHALQAAELQPFFQDQPKAQGHGPCPRHG